MKQVAFILSALPISSEICVAEEIRLLMGRLPGSRIYSLRPLFGHLLFENPVELIEAVRYVAPVFSWEVINSNLRWFLKRPGPYIMVLLSLILNAISNPFHLMRTLYLYPLAVHLAVLVESAGLDHLHSHCAGSPTLVARAVSKLLGIPFSFPSHACDISMFENLLAKEKGRKSDLIVSCSEKALGFLSNVLSKEAFEKVNVDRYSSNVRDCHPGLRHAHVGNRLVIISSACSYGRSGILFLLKALVLLKKANIDFCSFVVGENSKRLHLEKTVRELGFEGFVRTQRDEMSSRLIEDYSVFHMT